MNQDLLVESPVSLRRPFCTVVICTRDRPEYLERCLRSIATLTYPTFDVLVVDNAPTTDKTCQVARCNNVRYVVEESLGLSRARNLGARSSDSEIVAYLDDDAVPEPAWLEALIQEFCDPQVMAVTGRVRPLETESPTSRSGEDSPADREGSIAVDRDSPSWFELTNFGGIGNGTNMAFRRIAFESWPGFDTRLGKGAPLPGAEEHHAFFSLVKRGFKVVYTPHAVVQHPFFRSSRPTDETRRRYLDILSAATGYLALLWFEEPDYRWSLLRYAARRLLGLKSPWSAPVSFFLARPATLWQAGRARWEGLKVYFLLRRGGVAS